MIKNLTKIILISTLVFALNISIAFANFNDVSANHPNFEAINFLQENNIVHGYNDGTFKPENAVNRAEFLKIVLEGSSIPTNITTDTPFSDIDHTAWYAPYIKKAYAEGWIVGYQDRTYKPEQTINKAEALKIVGEVQNWELANSLNEKPFSDTPLLAWYTRYVDYAKTNNFLEESGSIFNPGELMTRAGISEMIFRTYDSANSNTTPLEKTPPPTNTYEENKNSYSFSKFAPDYFNNITLEENIPNIFYENELYIFEGNIESGNYETVTAFLDPDNNTNKDYIYFTENINNGHFKIPVYFQNNGNYNLGLIPGNSGDAVLLKISVMSALPTSSNSEKAEAITNFGINFSNGQTFADFTSAPSHLKRLNFTQNEKNISYLSRQEITEMPVLYSNFRDFNSSNVTYYFETAKLSSEKPLEISSQWVKSSEKTFTPVQHTFSEINNKKINANPPETLSAGGTINFNGQIYSDAQFEAYVIKPDGFVDKQELNTNNTTTTYYGVTTLPNGSDFNFNYKPAKTGLYILEINDKQGIPILNHPVYVGTKIPLLPDYFDLHQREFLNGSLDYTALRNELLNLINLARTQHSLPIVTIDTKLNDLAQAHSEDMAANGYFSHINQNNQTPEDRRITANIPTPVGENIAKDVSIEFAHYGLMRSATHRKAILDSSWEKVGIGVTLDPDGYLLIAEEFSTKEFTETNLQNMENELLLEIQDYRDSNGLDSLSNNNTLDQASSYLNNIVINNGESLTNESFQDALNQYNITGSSEALGRTSIKWSEILESLIGEEISLLDTVWESIGLDIQTDTIGTIHTLLILNNN